MFFIFIISVLVKSARHVSVSWGGTVQTLNGDSQWLRGE